MTHPPSRDVRPTSENPPEPLEAGLGDYYLFAVGIDEYEHFDRLNTPVGDVTAVAAELEQGFGFSRDRMFILRNGEATRSGIVDGLADLVPRLRDTDSLMVYFAGHGRKDRLGIGYWVPWNGQPDQSSTWIKNSEIKEILTGAGCQARHVWLVSDSCFPRTLLRAADPAAPPKEAPDVLLALRNRSRQVMTSGADEPVLDGGGGGHSIFAHFLLRELQRPANPYVVPSEVFPRIRKGVCANSRQTPLFGDLHGNVHGDLHGRAGGLIEPGGEFVLLRSGGLAKLQEQAEEARRKAEDLQRNVHEAETRYRQEFTEKESQLRLQQERIRQLEQRRKEFQDDARVLSDLNQAILERRRQESELEAEQARWQEAKRDLNRRRAELAELNAKIENAKQHHPPGDPEVPPPPTSGSGSPWPRWAAYATLFVLCVGGLGGLLYYLERTSAAAREQAAELAQLLQFRNDRDELERERAQATGGVAQIKVNLAHSTSANQAIAKASEPDVTQHTDSSSLAVSNTGYITPYLERTSGVSLVYDESMLMHRQSNSSPRDIESSIHVLVKSMAKELSIPKELVLALKQYRRSGEHGNSEAMFVLGSVFYESGFIEASVKCFRKSAEAGDWRSMCYLSLFYAYGHGVTRDLSQAAVWLRTAGDIHGTLSSLCFRCYIDYRFMVLYDALLLTMLLCVTVGFLGALFFKCSRGHRIHMGTCVFCGGIIGVMLWGIQMWYGPSWKAAVLMGGCSCAYIGLFIHMRLHFRRVGSATEWVQRANAISAALDTAQTREQAEREVARFWPFEFSNIWACLPNEVQNRMRQSLDKAEGRFGSLLGALHPNWTKPWRKIVSVIDKYFIW